MGGGDGWEGGVERGGGLGVGGRRLSRTSTTGARASMTGITEMGHQENCELIYITYSYIHCMHVVHFKWIVF